MPRLSRCRSPRPTEFSPTGACSAQAAVCANGNRPLTEGITQSIQARLSQVTADPLTAAFSNMPESHDGETEFWLELSFDAALAQGKYLPRRAVAALLRAAAALLAAALLAAPLFAQAQTMQTLISNLGQSDDDSGVRLGFESHRPQSAAQKFTIPSGIEFTLGDITIELDASPRLVDMYIAEPGSDGNPPPSTSALYTLTRPESLSAAGEHTFAAPAGATLEGGKDYFVYIKIATGAAEGTTRRIFTTNSDNVDAGGAIGWDIADVRRQRQGIDWSTEDAAIRMRISSVRSLSGSAAKVRFGSTGYHAIEGGAKATVAVTMYPWRRETVTIPLTVTNLGSTTAADYQIFVNGSQVSGPLSVTFYANDLGGSAGGIGKRFTVRALNDSANDHRDSVKFGFGAMPIGTVVEGEADGRAAKTATVWLLEQQTEMMDCTTPDTSAPFLGGLRDSYNPRRLNSKGQIKNSGDCVWYRVNLTNYRRHQIQYSDKWVQTNAPGQTYTSVLSQITSPQIKVYKPNGTPLVQDGSAVEDQVLEADRRFRAPLIRFTPATAGTYYLRVSSLGYDVGHFGIDYTDIGPGTAPATEAEPLTATLEDIPTNHDGSSAFTFRIAFSADVEITPEDMRDHALVVTGATVTNATRVDGRSDLWELTVEPAGTGAVSVLVPLNRACTETGALCTADGQMLTTAPGHSVPGPAPVAQGQQALTPLAAGFVSVPAEHDGETAFWLELSFDAAVEQGSKQRIRALLGVTGGSVTKLRRKDGRLDHWRVRVEPSSHEAVTVTLSPSPPCGATGAVCTEDGRTFTSALATQIQGPPGLTVADAQVQEAANATLAFAVTLSRAPSGTVTVDYATSDGTATAGSDYTAASGTLTFAAGETEKTVSVPVLDDAHDEGSETLTLTLSNSSGAYLADGIATGTINNTDHMPLAWMVRFGRTVGSQVVDALGQRLDGATGSHVTVGGINLTGAPGAAPEAPSDAPFGLPEWAKRAQSEASVQSLTANELLLGSAFHLSSGGGQGAGAAYTAWGRVARSGFEADVDEVTMDGDVTSALVGFDAEWERVLAGVMLSHSTGEGDYRLSAESGGRTGSVESTLTGVYPYARVALNARVSAWALAGAANGELTLKPQDDEPMPADITMRMGAVGFKGRVLDGTGASGLALDVKSDAMWVGTKSEDTSKLPPTEGDVTRLRVTLEGERVFAAGEGATFTPSAEVGLRHDGGDAETGAGLEVGAGLSYVAGALTVEGQVRTLVAHEDSGYEEWGASGAVRITPSASGQGLTLSIAPQWGRTASATERLWSAPDATALGAGGEFEGEARLALDAGYGVGLGHGRGVFTPYAGLVLGDAGSRTVRTGVRWQVGADAVLGLEGTRRTSGTGEAGNQLMLRVALRF